jgi:hypothetical protein
VRVRRFAEVFDAPLGAIPSATTEVVRLPADHSTLPWFVQVDQPTAGVALCS